MHRWKGLDERNTFIKKIWPNCAFLEVFYLKIPKDPKDPDLWDLQAKDPKIRDLRSVQALIHTHFRR